MSKNQAIEILKQYAQRLTDSRVVLLNLLMESPRAFALSEIESQLNVAMDRVTIYRTIQTFEEIGLVVRMVNRKGVCMYMFNHEAHNEEEKHPHLRCRSCGKVVCLPALPKEYLNRLEKYEIEEMYLLLEGLCSDCISDHMKL